MPRPAAPRPPGRTAGGASTLPSRPNCRHVQCQATARPPLPPLTSPSAPGPALRSAFDLAVVGGGTPGLLVAASAAGQGMRVVWLSWEDEAESSLPLPSLPSRGRAARPAAADARAASLAADGLAWWTETAPQAVDLVGCLDIAGRGEAGDALDAVAAAVVAAGVPGGCARLAAGEVGERVRGLVLPRGASGLWMPFGGVLDARAAADAAAAAAARAGVAVWSRARAGGWADRGSHFRLWGWRDGASAADGPTTLVAEVERLVVLPRPHAEGVGAPSFGLSLPRARVRWRAWARCSTAAAATAPGSTTTPFPLIHCAGGLAPPTPDAPPGGAHEAWAVLPGSPTTIARPPAAALAVPPWPAPDAVRADAAAAAAAAARALPPTSLGLPPPGKGGVEAAAAAGGGWPGLETADGQSVVGWAPAGGGFGPESGRVLVVAPAVGGSAGVADGLAASPALARAAARLLAGGAGGASAAAGLEPGRAGVGVEVGPPTHADTWGRGA